MLLNAPSHGSNGEAIELLGKLYQGLQERSLGRSPLGRRWGWTKELEIAGLGHGRDQGH